jgi:TPR repeat protein
VLWVARRQGSPPISPQRSRYLTGTLRACAGHVRADPSADQLAAQKTAERNLKMAEQGDPVSQDEVGLNYFLGFGVRQTFREAARWFRKAAEQGYTPAQGTLGHMYEYGQGVPKDYVEAYMWLNLAAADGIAGAAQGRDRLEHSMTGQQIAESQRRTAAWRPKHSGE